MRYACYYNSILLNELVIVKYKLELIHNIMTYIKRDIILYYKSFANDITSDKFIPPTTILYYIYV